MSFEVKGVGEGWRGYELPSEPRQHLPPFRSAYVDNCQARRPGLSSSPKSLRWSSTSRPPRRSASRNCRRCWCQPNVFLENSVWLASSATSGTRLDLTAEIICLPGVDQGEAEGLPGLDIHRKATVDVTVTTEGIMTRSAVRRTPLAPELVATLSPLGRRTTATPSWPRGRGRASPRVRADDRRADA